MIIAYRSKELNKLLIDIVFDLRLKDAKIILDKFLKWSSVRN
jgi:hypothetical protein